MHIHLDFETRSTCDLRRTGVDVYSRHPATEVLCVGFALTDDEGRDSKIRVTRPKKFLAVLKKYPGCKIVAHNAAFEIAIWNNVCVKRYGWPAVHPSVFECTMTHAYAMGLPGSLDNASAAVGLKTGKDMDGHRVMMSLCKPREIADNGAVVWWDEQEYAHRYQKLYKYCAQDVEVERQLFKRLRGLSDSEHDVWIMDQEINSRGIGIDVKAARVAFEIIQLEKERLNNDMGRVTEGFVPTCTANAALLRWLRTIHRLDIDSVAKPTVSALLRQQDKLPKEVVSALKLRQEAAKSSTAKIKKMLEVVGPNDRIRGAFQYHAATTGRWGGRMIQPQNFVRPKISKQEIEGVFGVLRGE